MTPPVNVNRNGIYGSQSAVYLRLGRRAFFVTEKGYFRIRPPGERKGDRICVLGRYSVPNIFRKVEEDEWEVIGECSHDYDSSPRAAVTIFFLQLLPPTAPLILIRATHATIRLPIFFLACLVAIN